MDWYYVPSCSNSFLEKVGVPNPLYELLVNRDSSSESSQTAETTISTHHKTGNYPSNARQEAKGLSGLPFIAKRVSQEDHPVWIPVAIESLGTIDEDPKGSEPGEGYEDVDYARGNKRQYIK